MNRDDVVAVIHTTRKVLGSSALAELAGLVSHAALATPVASPRARAAPWPASPVCLEVQCGHGQDFQPWLQSDDYLALVPRRASQGV
jgi:hypothetical protein